MKERFYILFRKMKAFGNKICFIFCRIFPIRNDLISVCTFEGKGGFGCNPKYLVQELHRRNPRLKFVWFVNDMNKVFPEYIRKVPNTLWSRAYWLSVSKVWIDNYRKPYGTIKRKRQHYLNTNHYTLAIKCIGLWREKGFSKMAYLVSKNDSDMIDDLVIDSKFCEEILPKGFIYSGSYLKTGAPRCDVLYGDRNKQMEHIRRRYQLPLDAKIVMFAPTFREGAKDGKRRVFSEIWTLDFKRLIDSLERKFGGVWYICIRVHPQLAPSFKEYRNELIPERLLDASQSDDMYEILAGMDAYITDYSSACFEAGFAKMPVFLYADDIERYTVDRGNLFWNIDENALDNVTNNRVMTPSIDTKLPFTVSTNNEMLERNIVGFDKQKYEEGIDLFCKEMQLVFNGNASKMLGDIVASLLIS